MRVEMAKANIEHFKKLLRTETDAKKRVVIERLLAEQEAKLAARGAPSQRRTDAFIPLAPVRWVHIDVLLSARFQPTTTNNASARKHERERAALVYHCQFEIAVERCGLIGCQSMSSSEAQAFRFGPDPNQNRSN
jgi:hypothetical protein